MNDVAYQIQNLQLRMVYLVAIDGHVRNHSSFHRKKTLLGNPKYSRSIHFGSQMASNGYIYVYIYIYIYVQCIYIYIWMVKQNWGGECLGLYIKWIWGWWNHVQSWYFRSLVHRWHWLWELNVLPRANQTKSQSLCDFITFRHCQRLHHAS